MHIPTSTQSRFKLPGPAVCQCGARVTQPEARNSVASLRLLEHWKSWFKLAHRDWHYTCTCGTWKLGLVHVHTAGIPASDTDSDHLPL